MKDVEPGRFIAHFRGSDQHEQSVQEHLLNVAAQARDFASKAGLASLGELCGLLHDVGKYSESFQKYIKSGVGLINPDEDDYVDAKGMKGKIDHSTAGAQYVWEILRSKKGVEWQVGRQIMALCIASHHSGLIDCLSPVGDDLFTQRIEKPKNRTNYEEVIGKMEKPIGERINGWIIDDSGGTEFAQQMVSMSSLTPMIGAFTLGMLTRFLFSSLIDADRLDSAKIEDPRVEKLRAKKYRPDWNALLTKLEQHVSEFKQQNNVDRIRADISARCADYASREKGLYLLTVPTGGGKTLASLRFALRHANQHKMERIIYVIPYTSIIDQNASVVRAILEDEKESGIIVLEHHSNLTPERDTWQSKILSENWDVPVVYTTAVQFLETLFASGTRGARRMHQLANAVIIFDEIQTLPIRTIHMFNNAINFLVGQCSSTVLFCTATQPILDRVSKDKGAARLSPNPEMMPDVSDLFRKLQRVEVIDERKKGGWQEEEIASRAVKELEVKGSVLVVVNTKTTAQGIYRRCKAMLLPDVPVYHLSTNMCPAHRMVVLNTIKGCLDPVNTKPVVCVSTQLIEAGVDIDFGCVIRCLAGLDSIAQAAGRCNRNGLRRPPGKVLVVNPTSENAPDDIRIAKEKAERVLDEFKKNPSAFDDDLIGPKTLELYYRYYFFERADEMAYPVKAKQIGREGELLSLLSTNDLSVEAYKRAAGKPPVFHLRQSFKSAAAAFEAIDAPTEGVIVPYGSVGRQIIGDLCVAFDVKKQRDLLRRAQRYSVNVFPNIFKKLSDGRCIHEVQEGTGIMYLDDQHYSNEFGLSTERVGPMSFLNG